MRVPIRGVHCATVVGAVLLLSLLPGPVRADDTLTATWDGTVASPSQTFTDSGHGEYGGVFNWNATTTNQGLGGIIQNSPSSATAFQAFCMETTQNLVTPITFNVVTNLANAPAPNPMGAAAAKDLNLLFGRFYYDPTANGGQGAYASGIDYVALQMAIWTIIQEGQSNNPSNPLNNLTAVLAFEQGNPGAAADYESYLTYINGNQDSTQLANYLVALTSDSAQDMLGIYTGGGNTPFAVPTPCPPGIVLSLIGIVGMGGYGWRRRRLLGR
jgi:hypothetical protein